MSGPGSNPAPEIQIVPDDIRDMARWVLLNCVEDQKLGGMTTKGIQSSLDWVVSPSSPYPGGIFRMYTTSRWSLTSPYLNLYTNSNLATSATYYSLQIWTDPRGGWKWNPGNQDPRVGRSAYDYANSVLKKTQDMRVYRKLTRAVATLEQAFRRMTYDSGGVFVYNWFDTHFPG